MILCQPFSGHLIEFLTIQFSIVFVYYQLYVKTVLFQAI